MALRSRIEPPSPHRQCGRLIQMRNEAMSMIRKSGNRFSLATKRGTRLRGDHAQTRRRSGALGRGRTGMVSHHPLDTARLPVSPRARIELEDLVGLEPTMLSQRIKN